MRNIVLIVLDTFRADYLSDYKGRKRLKNLEALALGSAVFTKAVAPSTYTAPSHTALFLGRRVVEIKSLAKGHSTSISTKLPKYINKGEMTLARKLGYLGYGTALFSSNPFVSEATGIAEGFSYTKDIVKDSGKKEAAPGALDMMVNSDFMKKSFVGSMKMMSGIMPEKTLEEMFIKLEISLEKRLSGEGGYRDLDMGAASLNQWVKEYLASTHHKKNFIFMNYMEAHDAYPTYLVSKSHVVQDRWLYMSGILDASGIEMIKKACWKRLEYLDSKIGELLDVLKEGGALDDAIVIVTSDHGQAFMEHGQMYHDLFPYSEIADVPLIVASFRNGKLVKEKKRFSSPVSLISLNEAIVDAAYGKKDWMGKLTGSSTAYSDHIGLVGWWGSEIVTALKDRSAHFKKLYKIMKKYDVKATAVYSGDYKLMHFYGKSADEMYNLKEDSGEMRNIVGSKKGLRKSMIKGV